MLQSKAEPLEKASSFVERMLDDPACFPELCYADGFKLTQAEVEAIHLTGLRRRFSELRNKVAVLDRVATDQSVDAINEIDDAALLLFPHTVYKSYPLSFLERGHYDRLTRWLQGLTALDLSGYDGEGVDSIDSWIRRLDQTTAMQLLHTSGTTGKLSFLPRARATADARWVVFANFVRDWEGPNSGPDLLGQPRPVIYPSYRYGASAPHRGLEIMARLFAGGNDNVLCLYPDDYFSADVASLAGRLKAAEAQGEQGKLTLSEGLLKRREEFIRRERDRPAQMERFFAEAGERFKGQNVLSLAMWPALYDWAEAGRERGLSKMFGPDSVVVSGGGSKGRTLPANAREIITDFLGFDRICEFYGMSEMSGNCPQCKCGNYHVPPFTVPYVLDAETSEPLPRTGFQTGRFGFVDLMPDSHWGGFITGDKVTVGWWDQPCACGRSGPYLQGNIQRFSELQGGDDKISCSGAPAAHDKAIEFLASIAV